jgi:hypothetical protein
MRSFEDLKFKREALKVKNQISQDLFLSLISRRLFIPKVSDIKNFRILHVVESVTGSSSLLKSSVYFKSMPGILS